MSDDALIWLFHAPLIVAIGVSSFTLGYAFGAWLRWRR